MAKVISQSTFDDVVKENMNEFDMDVDEAIEDAIKQFEAQDINLDNIVKDLVKYTGSGDNQSDVNGGENKAVQHPIVVSISVLCQYLDEPTSKIHKSQDIVSALQNLREQCTKDLAHRLLVAKENGFSVLMQILKTVPNSPETEGKFEIIITSLDTLACLLQGQPDIISDEPHLREIVSLLKAWNEQRDGNQEKYDNDSVLCRAISRALAVLRSACTLHEGHRQFLVNTLTIVPLVMSMIEKFRGSRFVVREACGVLRVLTVDDDMRVEFGHGHEHAKSIVMETNALGTLLRLCQEFNETSDHALVSEIFHTLSALSVRNEFCQQVLDQGGVDFLIQALENHYKHADIAASASALLKTLCGNDNVKLAVEQSGGIGVILLSIQHHIVLDSVVYHGCSALAAACLRNPEAAEVAVNEGNAPQIIAQILEKYSKNADVFRAACLAIRNIVSRSPHLREVFIATGVENLLNQFGLKLCGDEAKAALRDLGCQVHLVERWTGQRGHIPNN